MPNNKILSNNPTVSELALYVMMTDDANKAAIADTNENVKKIFQLFEEDRKDKIQIAKETSDHRSELSVDVATIKSQVIGIEQYIGRCDSGRAAQDIKISNIENIQARQAGRTSMLNTVWMAAGGLLTSGSGIILAWFFPSWGAFRDYIVKLFTHQL